MSGRHAWRDIRRPRTDGEERAHQERVERTRLALTLAEMREQMGATQEEVARTLAVSQPYISRIERSGEMSIASLRDYVQACGGTLECRAVFPTADDVAAPEHDSIVLDLTSWSSRQDDQTHA